MRACSHTRAHSRSSSQEYKEALEGLGGEVRSDEAEKPLEKEFDGLEARSRVKQPPSGKGGECLSHRG